MSARRSTPPPPGSNPRSTSVISIQQHAPTTPSSLRESHSVSSPPEETHNDHGHIDRAPSSSEPSPNTYPTHSHPIPEAGGYSLDTHEEEEGSSSLNERSALLKKPFEFVITSPHGGPCNHGTFSPGLASRAESVRSAYGYGGSPPNTGRPSSGGTSNGIFGGMLENVGLRQRPSAAGKKRVSTTRDLAERHGITNTTTM